MAVSNWYVRVQDEAGSVAPKVCVCRGRGDVCPWTRRQQAALEPQHRKQALDLRSKAHLPWRQGCWVGSGHPHPWFSKQVPTSLCSQSGGSLGCAVTGGRGGAFVFCFSAQPLQMGQRGEAGSRHRHLGSWSLQPKVLSREGRRLREKSVSRLLPPKGASPTTPVTQRLAQASGSPRPGPWGRGRRTDSMRCLGHLSLLLVRGRLKQRGPNSLSFLPHL